MEGNKRFSCKGFSTPTAIVLAGTLIAGALILSSAGVGLSDKKFNARVQKALEALQPSLDKMPAVTSNDHILGQKEAPVTMVVYTDFECPYCKVFHQSLKELEKDYIKDGKISVVYRALPLDQIHKKARPEAEAAECAAKLGGNEKYWQFVDKIFETTTSNDGLDLSLLATFAKDLGIDQTKFEKCQKDKTIAEVVTAQQKGGEQAGASGTPFPIIISGGKTLGALQGALPANELRKMVDELKQTPAAEKED